jgi:hypothetical protein
MPTQGFLGNIRSGVAELAAGSEMVVDGNPFVAGSWTLAAGMSVAGGHLVFADVATAAQVKGFP